MHAIRCIADRVELHVDARDESTSKLFARFVRVGGLCRELGLRKVLYVRNGPPADTDITLHLVREMPFLGFAGVRVAVVVSELGDHFPCAYVEKLARRGDVDLRVWADAAEAVAFLDDSASCEIAAA